MKCHMINPEVITCGLKKIDLTEVNWASWQQLV